MAALIPILATRQKKLDIDKSKYKSERIHSKIIPQIFVQYGCLLHIENSNKITQANN